NQLCHPEIYPLVLTTQTQEILNCRIDKDITDEQPYILIKKEDILADFQNRGAVSDFYPVKKVIQEYPGDELLVVYDKDFRYGLNFYLIGTEEGKENYLNPPEVPEEQEEYKEHIPEDVYVYKPPISKPWVSLGSEKEIEEESVKESTKQITYMISRKRSEFGAPIKFSDQNASSVKDAYIECTAYPDRHFTLKQLEKDVGMQVVPKIKDTTTSMLILKDLYNKWDWTDNDADCVRSLPKSLFWLRTTSRALQMALDPPSSMTRHCPPLQAWHPVLKQAFVLQPHGLLPASRMSAFPHLPASACAAALTLADSWTTSSNTNLFYNKVLNISYNLLNNESEKQDGYVGTERRRCMAGSPSCSCGCPGALAHCHCPAS
uniref:WD repeat domain 63 n=1 Tax=Ursus americanus TaxID=9643 RepID=A0A452QDV4_URSAM